MTLASDTPIQEYSGRSVKTLSPKFASESSFQVFAENSVYIRLVSTQWEAIWSIAAYQTEGRLLDLRVIDGTK